MVKPTTCSTCGKPVRGYSEDANEATLFPCGHTFQSWSDDLSPAGRQLLTYALLGRMTDHDPRRQKPDAEIETEPATKEHA